MLHVIESEKIPYNNQGLEALIFSSDGIQNIKFIGDMR
jgi:hypothetical protein